MAARPSIVDCSSSSFSLLPSRIQRSPRSVGSLYKMSKRGYQSLAGEPDSIPDIEDLGQKAWSPVRKKSRASQSLFDRFRRKARGTLLSVANSGATGGLISLLGCADDDIYDVLQLSEEFFLVHYPEQVALERLFRVDDIRVGATSRKVIPALIDILKPIPERPGALFLALGLLTQLARDCPSNKMVMVESGALEGLTKYLSLGPKDTTEEAATDLLGILFSSFEICKHESAFGAINQLVAVLRLGGRGARYSAAKTLESLFSADHIRNAGSSRQAVQPLVEVLNTGLEREQHAAIAALVRLLSDNPSRALAVANVEMNAVDVLCKILSSDCSMELKGVAAKLCVVLLVSLLVTKFSPSQHSVVCALDKLLDDEQLAELVSAYGAIIPFPFSATDVRLAAIAVGTGPRGGLGKLIIKRSDPTRGVTRLGVEGFAYISWIMLL